MMTKTKKTNTKRAASLALIRAAGFHGNISITDSDVYSRKISPYGKISMLVWFKTLEAGRLAALNGEACPCTLCTANVAEMPCH